MQDTSTLRAVLLDLDGTIYHRNRPVRGAVDFVNRVKSLDLPYLFITNNSTRTPAQFSEHLQELGVDCTPQNILTSSQATAAAIKAERVYCIGQEGLRSALREKGIEIAEQDVTHVVVGLDRQVNYEKIEKASRLIRAGARFIATNADRYFPTEEGFSPGNGAILAAIATASDVQPIVIGKPERAIIDIALAQLQIQADEAVLIGDNLETDILAGINAGVRTVFLMTGVSSREDLERLSFRPTWLAADCNELNRLFDEIVGM